MMTDKHDDAILAFYAGPRFQAVAQRVKRHEVQGDRPMVEVFLTIVMQP
jgi:hypothetical protein